jgi:S-adenosylmethionine/arginine decarboxylase-like enzyme
MIQKKHYIKTIIIMSNNRVAYQMYSDIRGIENKDFLDILKVKDIMDVICRYNNFTIIDEMISVSQENKINIIYLLEDFHMSINTFPDNDSMAFEFCTFKADVNFHSIFEFLVEAFKANNHYSTFNIIDRHL